MWLNHNNAVLEALAVEVANDISVYSTHGLIGFKKIMNYFVGSFEEEQLLIANMEFNIFLVYITGKLLSNYYDNTHQDKIISKIIDGVKQNFCDTKVIKSIISDKSNYFDKYFQKVYYTYPTINLVLEKSYNVIKMYFSQRLITLFLKDEIEAKRNFVQAITYNMLEYLLRMYGSQRSVSKIINKNNGVFL